MMTRLANWFRRGKLESGLERELRYHLDRRISDFERAGLSAQEARRQAVLELGTVSHIQEEVRDVWLTRWLRDFFYDLRFSARSFRKTPSFTITAFVSLALGIGATTAIYSLVDQVLLHALPVREPQNLVLIDWKGDQAAHGFGSWNLMSYPLCQDLNQKKEFFDGVFCRALMDVNVSTNGDSRPMVAEIVSGNYFLALGVGPALGAVITHDDDQTPNGNPVAVLSYDSWKTQFGGAPDIVGRKVLVNRHPFTVIGVAAAAFRGIDVGTVPALWIPASMSSETIPGFKDLLDRRTRWLQVLGRLKPGVTLADAQIGLQPWFKGMLREDERRPGFPAITEERRRIYRRSSLQLTGAPQGHSGLRRRLEEPLWMLLAVTAVLLGLACLNVSGLFLARGSAREREISTRMALGASRGRLGRQLLSDSLLISLAGGLLGVMAAPVAVRALIAFLPTGTSTSALHANVDWSLLLFALAVALAAGLLSGLAPAWQSGRRSFASSLRERSGTGAGGVRLRKIIVAGQIALTVTLVVGAALFAGSLNALMVKGPGFATTRLVSFGVDPSRNGQTREEAERLMRQIDEAVRESPVTEASGVVRFPLLTGGSWNDPITIFARTVIASDRDVHLNSVTPGFLQTMGIRLIAGRNFDAHDVGSATEQSWHTALVNEAFVKRYLPGQNPLGMRICIGEGPQAKPAMEIVGVMSNFSYRGIREDSEQVYFPFFQGYAASGSVYVRVHGKPESAEGALRTAVRKVDPSLPLTDLRTVSEQVDRSLNTEHLLATLSESFSILALLLSLVGLYGVMSFVVTQRTREIGIRLALGAGRGSAIWLVVRDALVMIGGGLCIGLPVAWALARLVQSQLFEVKASDPGVVAMVVLVLGPAGLAAALIPAHRASGVNPTEALRVD